MHRVFEKASPLSPAAMSAVANADLFEALYAQWKQEPGSVGEDWRMFFAGFELAM